LIRVGDVTRVGKVTSVAVTDRRLFGADHVAERFLSLAPI